jgi:hypothetical protein
VNAAATAQDAYRRMLREYIAPTLRELGFRRRPSPGAFRYETATHAAVGRDGFVPRRRFRRGVVVDSALPRLTNG